MTAKMTGDLLRKDERNKLNLTVGNASFWKNRLMEARRELAESLQEIEILKTDLHIADRALEIHPDKVDLRKELAESQIALGEIFKCDICRKGICAEHWQLARNATKGGK